MQRKNRKTALQKATEYLARSEQSSSMIMQKLLQSGYDVEEAETAINTLRERHFIDDAAACRSQLAYMYEDSSQSMRQIHAKLIRRGFPSELISEAIDELDGCEDREIEAAMKALRHRSWKSGDRQKMKAYLYRKGFSYDVASSAVEAFIDADRERFMKEEEEDD